MLPLILIYVMLLLFYLHKLKCMKKLSLLLAGAFLASTLFVLPMRADSVVKTTADVAFSADSVSCMQNAVDARDTTIATAYSAFATTVKNALDARTTAIKAAWGMGGMSQIKPALATAWQDYRRAVVSGRIDLRKAKLSAWNTFKTARKGCLNTDKSELDNSDMNSDAQL